MRIAIEFFYCSENCVNYVCPYSLDDEEQHLGHISDFSFETHGIIMCGECSRRVIMPPDTTFTEVKNQGLENANF